MWKKCLFLVVLTMIVGRLSAQNVLTEHYQMTTLDLSSGLPHNHVNQFFVDSKGFVWISTYGGGAVRYDGFSFMTTALANPQGWSSNSCKSIAEDSHQRLWIAYDERTDVIDMRTMSRTTPKSPGGDISSMLDRLSVKVYSDSKGALWQVAGDTIFRYTFGDNGDITHIGRLHYIGNVPDICIKDIEDNGTVWACVDGGLYRLAERGGKLVREDIAPVMSQLRGLYVTDILKRGSKIWITTNQGLYAYDQYARTMQSFRHTADATTIAHDFTTSLAETPDGRLMIGSLRGINILDEQQGTFSHWDNSTAVTPLPSDFVHCLMVRDGQIWIGTETAGIVKLSPRPLLLHNHAYHPADAGSLSPRPVNAIYVEADGTLWAGTVEGGLNRRGAGDKGFVHWTTQNSGLSHNSVSVLEADAHGQLWIGTWGGGLNMISLSDHQRVVHVDMPAAMVAQTNYIGSLAYDQYNDALWIGSNDGVFYYDLKTGSLEDPFEDNRNVRGCIGSIVDKQGMLWMGCMTGVRVIDLRSRQTGRGKFRVRSLYTKLDHPESGIVDKISCFYEAKDGTLWLGSNGYGLYRRMVDEKGKETFRALTTDDGLANNSVKGIVEDVQGRLWITTANGLSVYDPHACTFINYGERDGLLCQRFYWNSAVKDSDGTIYLGSMKGLIEVVDENKEAVYPVHLTFTRLMVDNQVVTASKNSDFIDADISSADVIHLHESTKSFTIEFSALTYAGEATGHYSYRLKGFEDDWISLKHGEHSVRYTSLKPGNYTFEVKYSTDLSSDEEHKIYVQVHVAPYFWKSWWFTLMVIMALIGFVVWFYRYKEQEWKRQEAEKLLTPIRKVLEDAEEPQQLQSRIQNILDNHEKLKQSYHKSVEADKQEVMQHAKPFMNLATEILEQHYSDSEFGVTEFAEAIGMSKPLLSKRLNAEAGVSTGQFIRNYRLTIAKRLLLENHANRNVTEIAYKVGFNDPKYFTRCFTHQYGCSPSAFVGEVDSEKG
ncbi:MAG: helix-turn-helix domain-containing protein [Prevotella sp.]|nr:helix-turn-helix domain-containing protein [Prevotella sp.]